MLPSHSGSERNQLRPKAKGTACEYYSLVDNVVPQGGKKTVIPKPLYMCAAIRQLSKWKADEGSQVSLTGEVGRDRQARGGTRIIHVAMDQSWRHHYGLVYLTM